MSREPEQEYSDDYLYVRAFRFHPRPWSYKWTQSRQAGRGKFVLIDAKGKLVGGRAAMIRICRDINKDIERYKRTTQKPTTLPPLTDADWD